MRKRKSISNMLSGENGELSAKKVFGGFIITVILGCIVYSVVEHGITHDVVELMDTAMIVGATLLGLTSITSIWKNNKNFKIDDNKCEDKTDKPKENN